MGASAVRLAALAAAAFLWTASPSLSAGGDRTLSLYNMNTAERLTVTFYRDGAYDPDALGKLDWFLRDWRRDEAVAMDRRLYDIVWEIYRETGSKSPIHVHSGYRSRATNTLLRKRSKAVASESQHMAGTAMDFHVPGVTASELRDIAMRMQDGGVGFYPKANNPFVHVDVAGIRHWPRMSRNQLIALFPDGVSLHVPSDGRPLKGFAEALGKAARGAVKAVAELPKEIPFPMFRPDRPDPTEEFPPAPPPALASLPDLSAGAFFPAAAYVPERKGKVMDLILDPHREPFPAAEGKVSRSPLPDLAPPAASPEPATDLTDAGPGKKGPRLRPGPGWKIGGYL